jgi:hypothetical protein
MSEAELKRQLRKSTTHSEEDIMLLLSHLRHTGKMAVEVIDSKADKGDKTQTKERDGEMVICKFNQVDNRNEVSITLREKGKFALNVNLNRLNQRIELAQT